MASTSISAGTSPRAASGTRDAWLDNAKMALVTLVVIGHAWVLLPDSPVRDTAYHALYVWHMPAFVLVTGYLSRSFAWTAPRIRSLILTVLVPYLVFEAALAVFRISVGGERLDRLFLDPHWPMWFLAALFVWRLATPVIVRLRHPLLIAVAISLLGGYVGGDIWDVARIMGFLPFYVAGLTLTRDRPESLRTVAWRRAGVVLLVGVTAAAALLHPYVSMELLYYRSTYAEAGLGAVTGPLARLTLLVIATACAAGFLALLPRRHGWFSTLGSATLVVYLFHGFAIKGFEYSPLGLGWTDRIGPAGQAVGLVLAAATGAALSLLLAAPPVVRRLMPAVDPLRTIDDLNARAWAETIPARDPEAPLPPEVAAPVAAHWPGQLR